MTAPANTKSFQEVIQLARELWEYVNQKNDETETPVQPQSENGQQSADKEQEIDFEDQDEQGEDEDGEYEDYCRSRKLFHKDRGGEN